MAISPYLPAAFPVLPAALLLLSELAELILVSPRIRLLEASLCRTHYLALDPPVLDPVEALCKLESIQTRLAYIRGWQVFFEAIPVMLLAVPWGALADRVGKKRVLAVNFMGCAVHIAWFAIVCKCAGLLRRKELMAAPRSSGKRDRGRVGVGIRAGVLCGRGAADGGCFDIGAGE